MKRMASSAKTGAQGVSTKAVGISVKAFKASASFPRMLKKMKTPSLRSRSPRAIKDDIIKKEDDNKVCIDDASTNADESSPEAGRCISPLSEPLSEVTAADNPFNIDIEKSESTTPVAAAAEVDEAKPAPPKKTFLQVLG